MIYAIVMAGGLGSRLKAPGEKPIYKLNDIPLIEHVLNNLKGATSIDKIFVAISPNTPDTGSHLSSIEGIEVIDTLGVSYMYDLSFVLDYFEKESKEDTLFFINADLPFINSEIIEYILQYYSTTSKDSLAIYVPIEIYQEWDLTYSYDYNGLVPAGVNVLRSENIVQDQDELIIPKPHLAFNINTLQNAKIASRFKDLK